jgi:hypothetical protein
VNGAIPASTLSTRRRRLGDHSVTPAIEYRSRSKNWPSAAGHARQRRSRSGACRTSAARTAPAESARALRDGGGARPDTRTPTFATQSKTSREHVDDRHDAHVVAREQASYAQTDAAFRQLERAGDIAVRAPSVVGKLAR